MGRHSRRGPAPKATAPKAATSDAASRDATAAARDGRPLPDGASGAARGGPPQQPARSQPQQWPGQGWPGHPGQPGQPPGGVPGQSAPYPTPSHGVPVPSAHAHRTTGPAPAHGQRPAAGHPQGHAPPQGYGTPAQHPAPPYGTPPQGVQAYPEGTPAQGVPRLPDGTPAHGFPRLPDGTPAHGVPRARGGHPEQREAGGGWGQWESAAGPAATTGHGTGTGTAASLPRPRQAPPGGGPRQDYLDAFDDADDLFTPRTPPAAGGPAAVPPVPPRRTDPYASVTEWPGGPGAPASAGGAQDDAGPPLPPDESAQAKGSKGRAFTGIAAAAVTTVLAVVVAGQVAEGGDASGVRARSATDEQRDIREPASRGDDRETPADTAAPDARPATYEEKMGATYPLKADLDGSGTFDAIPGIAKGTGKGQRITYRVDVEQGLGLDGDLFAEAVQKTLNDDRSWAHNGARTFERIHSGRPDFVITLASPGTTAEWCAKSGLDTTVDNVSCDSAATERVMINAYRWAQGAEPYGDKIHAYRQMLINHEIGHRLGYGHVTCDKDGDLAPVMQQQTKFVDPEGIDCRPNPWPYPNS
ncbi:DUF3152 domain-containing protein [Streptomyces sp. enrichment culture]|uniref:DUF3152 domain-containing protein n=1 Tax=Streptomyces sp. enrichment culture TaxID=1795815 RepID=UPI003F577822